LKGEHELKLSLIISAGAALLMASCAEAETSAFSSGSTTQALNIPLSGPFAAPRNCPQNYAGVPGDSEKQIEGNQKGVRGFCISKFVMKHPRDENGRFVLNDNWTGEWNWRPDTTSTPESKSTSRQWILISYQEALQACSRIKSVDFSYSLISSYEWDVLANNISQTAENWSQQQVSLGELARGFRILNINNPDEATYIRNHVCAWKADPRGFCPAPLPVAEIWNDHSDLSASTGKTSTEQFVQKRTHMLSNGQTIWDFGGNVSEWVMRSSEAKSEIARGGNFSDVSADIFTKIQVANLPDEPARRMHSTEARQTFVGFRCVARPIH
jgi:hypothetical protein